METSETPRDASIGQIHTAASAERNATIGQRIDRVCGAVQTAWRGGKAAVTEIKSIADIDGRVERNPYVMLAAAAGSGYVLGGGIFSPVTARIVGISLRLGLRLAAVPFIQRELLGFVEAANASGKPAESPGHQAQQTNVTSNQQETK